MVWAFSELLIEPMASAATYERAREQAVAVNARRRAEEEARKPKLSPAPGSVEWMQAMAELSFKK